jgi:lipopolysaccharide transport system ATP-binding protein
MSAPLLCLENIGKSYRDYPSQFRRFCSWFGLGSGSFTDQWILRNISFLIRPGEAVGIVGRNGAGKSTLLRIITGTLAATEGSCVLHGRVNAILELGMGFNQELSGRENVLHACGLMGHDQAAIMAALPDIESFAEIGTYFDQPVRVYSSGMQMRLAFAVATAFRPELLIVDEALSVGDAYFQHKSFDRIRRFQAQGTTLLIVSHDRSAILSLCDRVVLLEHGRVLQDGDPETVLDFYNALIADQEESVINQSQGMDSRTRTFSGNGAIVFEEISLLDADGRGVELVEVGSRITLRLRLRAQRDVGDLVVGYMLRDRLGQTIFGTNTHHLQQSVVDVKAGRVFVYSCVFAANLGPGSYSFTVAAHGGRSHLGQNYEWRDLALVFMVVNSSRYEFVGCNWMEPVITIESDHE